MLCSKSFVLPCLVIATTKNREQADRTWALSFTYGIPSSCSFESPQQVLRSPFRRGLGVDLCRFAPSPVFQSHTSCHTESNLPTHSIRHCWGSGALEKVDHESWSINSNDEIRVKMQTMKLTSLITTCDVGLKVRKVENFNFAQEPITWGVQLPYSVCATLFLQVELFLDIKAFTQISSQ